MKVNLINRQDDIILNLDFIQKVSNYISDKFDEDSRCEANLILVSSSDIRQINNQYRQVDAATDVISFSYLFEKDREDIKKDIESGKQKHGFYTIGEIIICPMAAEDNALEQGKDWNLDLEICLLIIHGFLHIYGYDHEVEEDRAVMFKKQDSILEDVIRTFNLQP
ncbi:MAG: rRNA maturation RNase YbeY [Actinomycetia bacterium]|nr:rRNA maturation RNase YbeY [Actinomycetes bacterium]